MTTPQLELCELADLALAQHESASPFCLKAHRALRLCQLPYTRVHGKMPASFKQLNPAAQVPVLRVDGEPVADSSRILATLDRIRPGVLFPADPALRAEVWLWEELADTAVNGFLVAARWADDANWPQVKESYFGGMPGPVKAIVPAALRRRVMASLHARDVTRAGPAALAQRFSALLAHLDARAPHGGFWVGNRATAADVALFAQLHSLRTPLTPAQSAQVNQHARLASWLDRVQALTAQQATATPPYLVAA